MSDKDMVMELIRKGCEYGESDQYDLSIPILEKALNIANQYDDIWLQIDARLDLIDHYVRCNDIVKAYINFVWYYNQVQKGYVNERIIYYMIWHYKYLAASLHEFTGISKEKINGFFDNMEKDFIKYNISLRPYYSLRMFACIKGIDNGVSVKTYRKKYLSSSKDGEYDDCIACTIDSNVGYYLSLGEDERALKEATNLINGRYRCGSVPHVTFASLLLPLYGLEKYDLAHELHIRGFRLIQSQKRFYVWMYYHIMYLALTNIEKGISAFEKTYKHLFKAHITDKDRLNLYACAYVLFSKLLEKDVATIKLKIPKDAPIYSENRYDVKHLKQYFKDEMIKLVHAFDERNKNHCVSDPLKEQLRICQCTY